MIKPYYHEIYYLYNFCNEISEKYNGQYFYAIKSIVRNIENDIGIIHTEFTIEEQRYKVKNFIFDSRGFLYVISMGNSCHLVFNTDL